VRESPSPGNAYRWNTWPGIKPAPCIVGLSVYTYTLVINGTLRLHHFQSDLKYLCHRLGVRLYVDEPSAFTACVRISELLRAVLSNSEGVHTPISTFVSSLRYHRQLQ
jgi:hypothetical protein